MRMQMRRFTRLTNAFSKRSKTILRLLPFTTCATISAEYIRLYLSPLLMEAGISDRLWSIDSLAGLIIILWSYGPKEVFGFVWKEGLQ